MKQIEIVDPILPEWNELEKDFKQILKSKRLVLGKWTEKVEKKICKLHECKYSLLVSSATMALTLLIKSAKKRYLVDKAIVTDYTFKSVKDVVEDLFTNFEYIDFEEEKNLSYSDLLIPNMFFGNTHKTKHPFTIYDSSHCLGNKECNGRGIGEILSFAPAKIIVGGEGGAIITNDKKIYEDCKKMRRYHGRLSEINACLLYHNLRNLWDKKDSIHTSFSNYYLHLSFKDKKWEPFGDIEEMTSIIFTHPKLNNRTRKELSKYMRIKQRYEPSDPANENSKWIYNHMIMLPVLHDKKQRFLIKKLLEIVK